MKLHILKKKLSLEISPTSDIILMTYLISERPLCVEGMSKCTLFYRQATGLIMI